MRMCNRRRRGDDWRDDRWFAGSASVELALISPILILLFFGMWDFGRAWNEAARLASAAYAGAQYGAQSAGSAADAAGIAQAARDDAADATGALTVTATQVCQCPSGAQTACDATCGAAGQPRMYVQVQVTEPFQTWFPYPFVSNPMTLSKQTILRVY